MKARMKMKVMGLVMGLSLAGVGHAATNVWQGANTASGSVSQVWVDDPALWSLGWVPTSGDTAVFSYYGTNMVDIHIDSTNLFAPSALVFNTGVGSLWWQQTNLLYLDKSLTLSNLVLTTSVEPSGTRVNGRLRIGTVSPVTVTLTGNGEALDIANGGAAHASWYAIILGNTSRIVDFQGSTIAFSSGYPTNTVDYLQPTAATYQDDSSGSSNAVIKFSTDSASIHLAGQGVRGASLGVGVNNLQVCTGQTWTADATAYASFWYRYGSGGAGPEIVQCLNGTRLDNLGALNITVGRMDAIHTTKATGMRLLGGTYGSLRLAMGTTSLRNGFLVQKGDVVLKGLAVTPPSGGTPAAVTDASLLVDAGMGANGNYYYVDTDGYALSLTNSLKVLERSATNLAGSVVIFSVTGSVVTVGGDVVIHSDNHGPWAVTNGISVSRYLGFHGDAVTVLNLKGNYSNDCASLSAAYSANGLTRSTVNLVGGAAWRTFEVGDAVTNTTYRSGSFAMGTLNVGDGATSGRVRLVNDFLNDNPLAASNDLDRVGEKLTVSNLNIKAGSTLDCNGQVTEVWGGLTVASDATLDLASGLSLTELSICSNFYGIGDRTVAWSPYESRVSDSDNPARTFFAFYDTSGNRTYWRANPTRGSVFRFR